MNKKQKIIFSSVLLVVSLIFILLGIYLILLGTTFTQGNVGDLFNIIAGFIMFLIAIALIIPGFILLSSIKKEQ